MMTISAVGCAKDKKVDEKGDTSAAQNSSSQNKTESKETELEGETVAHESTEVPFDPEKMKELTKDDVEKYIKLANEKTGYINKTSHGVPAWTLEENERVFYSPEEVEMALKKAYYSAPSTKTITKKTAEYSKKDTAVVFNNSDKEPLWWDEDERGSYKEAISYQGSTGTEYDDYEYGILYVTTPTEKAMLEVDKTGYYFDDSNSTWAKRYYVLYR